MTEMSEYSESVGRASESIDFGGFGNERKNCRHLLKSWLLQIFPFHKIQSRAFSIVIVVWAERREKISNDRTIFEIELNLTRK